MLFAVSTIAATVYLSDSLCCCIVCPVQAVLVFSSFVPLLSLLHYRRSLKQGSSFYFSTAIVAYVLGLVLTVFVMHTFKAAQPALLYLVPMGVLTPLLLSVARGEAGRLFRYGPIDMCGATVPCATVPCYGMGLRLPRVARPHVPVSSAASS